MLRDCDIDAIVELDRINMAPVIERAGGKFDPAFRRRRVQREVEEGAEFVCHMRGGVLIAYLEFVKEAPSVWNVFSIQIHPDHQRNVILLPLLREGYRRLRRIKATSIRSSVHAANRPSLRLHEKLGFQEEQRTADRIIFRISGEQLSRRLAGIFQKATERKTVDKTSAAVTSDVDTGIASSPSVSHL